MNNMKDYHDLYSNVGVLLLACVLETFRKESINSFELDLAHYLSTPGYSWDIMLKFTDVNFGISMICKGHAEAKANLLHTPYT